MPRERLLRILIFAAAAVVLAHQTWSAFFRDTPALTIQGFHRQPADEFGRGVAISQAFHFNTSGFTAVEVQFSTDRPLTLLLRAELTPIDDPNAQRTAPAVTQLVTLKRVSGVEWRRISFSGEEASGMRWYLLRLELIDAVPVGESGPVPAKTPAERQDRVGVIVSIDNVYGGGAMWIGERRQIGSLSLRAFSRWPTAYRRFRVNVAPTLPRAVQSGLVEIAIAAAYQLALLVILYALLIGDARTSGAGAASD